MQKHVIYALLLVKLLTYSRTLPGQGETVFCDADIIYAKLCSLIIYFATWHVLTWKVIEINIDNIEVNSFSIFRENLQFSVRVQIYTLLSGYRKRLWAIFWYRVKRGRCSISIALTKLEFNVHAVSTCICKKYHGRRKKLDHLPQNLKVLTDFFRR